MTCACEKLRGILTSEIRQLAAREHYATYDLEQKQIHWALREVCKLATPCCQQPTTEELERYMASDWSTDANVSRFIAPTLDDVLKPPKAAASEAQPNSVRDACEATERERLKREKRIQESATPRTLEELHDELHKMIQCSLFGWPEGENRKAHGILYGIRGKAERELAEALRVMVIWRKRANDTALANRDLRRELEKARASELNGIARLTDALALAEADRDQWKARAEKADVDEPKLES